MIVLLVHGTQHHVMLCDVRMVEGADTGSIEGLEGLVIKAVVDEASGRVGQFADGETRSGGSLLV